MVLFEERESVVLQSAGQRVFGILHLPKNNREGEKPPCVLICHGLGGHKTGRYRIYVDLAEALTVQGMAVFRFDFRGSGDSEGHFSEMTLQGEVADALCALEYLEQEPRIDNQRLAIFGRSLGGAVAVLSAARFGKARSLALWAPIYNGDPWRDKWERVSTGAASTEESEEMRRINGQVAGMEFYAELFTLNIKKELPLLHSVPLLLIHGEQDDLVTIDHSDQYMEGRSGASVITEMVRLPHADHDFTHVKERSEAIQRTAAWFKETLCSPK